MATVVVAEKLAFEPLNGVVWLMPVKVAALISNAERVLVALPVLYVTATLWAPVGI